MTCTNCYRPINSHDTTEAAECSADLHTLAAHYQRIADKKRHEASWLAGQLKFKGRKTGIAVA